MTGASRVSRSIARLTGWYSAGSVRVRDSGQRAGEASEAGHRNIDSPHLLPMLTSPIHRGYDGVMTILNCPPSRTPETQCSASQGDRCGIEQAVYGLALLRDDFYHHMNRLQPSNYFR